MPAVTARAQAKPYRHAGSHAEPAARSSAAARSKLYNPRHPERTVLYRTVAAHLETWLALASPDTLTQSEPSAMRELLWLFLPSIG